MISHFSVSTPQKYEYTHVWKGLHKVGHRRSVCNSNSLKTSKGSSAWKQANQVIVCLAKEHYVAANERVLTCKNLHLLLSEKNTWQNSELDKYRG